MIKQAVISAGGLGTRLRPHTHTTPKPMIMVLGKPLLLWQIEQFKKYGVTEFFITLHHLPQVVMDYFGDGSQFGVTITYFVEKESLGSAGGIKQFADKLDATFFLVYGDMISFLDYEAMEAAYHTKKNPIGMQRVQKTDDYVDADVVELDNHNKIIAVHPKPHTEKYPEAYRTRGTFILDKKIMDYIPKNKASDFGRDVLAAIVADGKSFYGYECDEYSKGIDTVEKWREVEEHIAQRTSQGVTAQHAPEKSGTPVVSVLMTTYRHPIFIEKAIESIQEQTLAQWELIIVDDSEDNATEEAVKPLMARDSRIHYFHREKKGNIANASNFGLLQARGEFIAILDDDDYWIDAHKLEKQVAFLRAHPDYLACGGWFISVNESGKEIARFKKPETDEAIRRVMLSANALANSTAMFRREASGCYDESMKQFADADFFRRLGTIGKLYNFPEYFLAYRMWEKGSSFMNQRGNADAAITMFWKYQKDYPGFLPGFISAYSYWLYARLPAGIRRNLNGFMSRLKKMLFSR
jgi:NDP-sugar pyrophosphorylase family protein/glycosyltransferase involved in cell wall biosynthesis